MILSEAKKILTDSLSPYSYDDFFDFIVGKKPLALLQQPNEHRLLLLGRDPKATLLANFASYAPNLTCHIHKPIIPPPEARAVQSASEFQQLINEYHQTGYTVRIPELQGISAELSLFTRALEFIIQNPVAVVCFWSQQDARAPVHYDDVDVIVIQLVGTKRWYISEQQPKLANKWKSLAEGPPTLEPYKLYDVQPGDLLYLPRGTAHTVESTSESVHLSIGFVPVTIREAIAAALDFYSDLDRPLRADLGQRADQLSGETGAALMHQQIRQGIEKLRHICQSDLFLQDALQFRQLRMVENLAKLPAEQSGQNQLPLSLHDKVHHHPLAIAAMLSNEKITDLRFPGKQTLIHKGAEAAVCFMQNNTEFTPAQLPGELSDEVKLALVNKWLYDGFLQRS